VNLQDLMLQQIIGMDKEEFERTAGLMRNPEGSGKPGRCPVCKNKLIKNDRGDLFCVNFDVGYKKNGKCFWHRYEDGLNYWSTPEEMFKSMCDKDPEFKAKYNQVYSSL
jgi:hypothetical protein